jgi:DNA-binding CsgD family transcriptional regulator
MDRLLHCVTETDFNETIAALGRQLGFEFLLYAYMKTSYDRNQSVHFVNISNPVKWMEEYHREKYVETDPVRMELEKRLADGNRNEFVIWDSWNEEIRAAGKHIVERRCHFGLKIGCSVFFNSPSKESLFLLSLARRDGSIDKRTEAICVLLVTHMNSCRKRLDLLSSLSGLSAREREVATWLAKGKSNGEIARIMGVTESTIKFHATGIFKKLHVSNRQSAVSVLLAAQYLS